MFSNSIYFFFVFFIYTYSTEVQNDCSNDITHMLIGKTSEEFPLSSDRNVKDKEEKERKKQHYERPKIMHYGTDDDACERHRL